MLKGVLVKVCLPVVFGFINAFQVILQVVEQGTVSQLPIKS